MIKVKGILAAVLVHVAMIHQGLWALIPDVGGWWLFTPRKVMVLALLWLAFSDFDQIRIKIGGKQ